jgi:tetratricopeptide (TPR) repeat protein
MRKMLLAAAALGFSTIISAQTDSSALFLQKGLEEKTKGRRMESMKQFEKAYSYNKNSKEVVAELASAYFDLRRYAQAKEKYVQLEGLGDKSAATYKQLMSISFNMRQFDDAIKYAQALKKADGSQQVAYYIGKANYEKENLGEALKYLDIAAKEDPKNAEVPYLAARAYADMQNFKQALPYFQKAMELNPNDARLHYEAALIFYAANDDKNSLKYMQAAADKGIKQDNEFLQNLSMAYLNAGQFNEGIKLLEQALAKRPSDLGILNMLAEAHYDAKKYDEAIRYWDDIMKINNNNAEALYMIGMAYQKKGDKAKGQQLCDKAIEMDPSLSNLKQKKQMPGGF